MAGGNAPPQQTFRRGDTAVRLRNNRLLHVSGYESDDYMNDPGNHGAYDVNTIANYDPDIVPFLDAPIGSAFERENGTGPFVEVHGESAQAVSAIATVARHWDG
jgi:hypothetical protein